MVIYKGFLNGPCNFKFNRSIDKEFKKLQYRDLTGPEKNWLFQNIKNPRLFPTLNTKDDLQKLWKDFYSLVQQFGKSECDDVYKFEKYVKSKFTSLSNQRYHPLYAFLHHAGTSFMFTWQYFIVHSARARKLNDITTKFYQRSSNHHDFEGLDLVLQKHSQSCYNFKDFIA